MASQLQFFAIASLKHRRYVRCNADFQNVEKTRMSTFLPYLFILLTPPDSTPQVLGDSQVVFGRTGQVWLGLTLTMWKWTFLHMYCETAGLTLDVMTDWKCVSQMNVF
jgi:hypothetical protein